MLLRYLRFGASKRKLAQRLCIQVAQNQHYQLSRQGIEEKFLCCLHFFSLTFLVSQVPRKSLCLEPIEGAKKDSNGQDAFVEVWSNWAVLCKWKVKGRRSGFLVENSFGLERELFICLFEVFHFLFQSRDILPQSFILFSQGLSFLPPFLSL